jgi:hypothetical protein
LDLVERFWQLLKDAGWVVLNHREGQGMLWEELEVVLEFRNCGKRLPYVPTGSQTVRIVKKGASCFFIYAHENNIEHGFWGIGKGVFDQIRGQETISWAHVFLKESETEGWWATPANVEQLVRWQHWYVRANGDYLVEYPTGVHGCLPFHSGSELFSLLDDFA